MNVFWMIVAAFFLGAGSVLFLCRHALKRMRRKLRALRESDEARARKQVETMKKVVWLCLGNGFAWIWCSYVLAYMGREQIAETLSSVAVKEIIGVVLVYAAKSAVENLSKNNCWPDKADASEAAQEDHPGNDL